jgi:hypothetical protein
VKQRRAEDGLCKVKMYMGRGSPRGCTWLLVEGPRSFGLRESTSLDHPEMTSQLHHRITRSANTL